MKVLIMNSARKFIGEAAHCLALAAQLRMRGHEAVLCVRHGYELEARALQAGLPVLALTMCGRFHPARDLCDVLTLRKWLREGRFDLVHCHRGKDHWLAAMTSTTLVRTRHVIVPMAGHALNRWLLKKRTARIIAVSRKAAESLGPMLPELEQRMTVIYSAVDVEQFNPSHRSETWRRGHDVGPGAPLVGLVARIQNIKGQHVFLRAASEVRRKVPNVRFLIAGAGTEYKLRVLRRRIAEAGLADCVLVLGWLDDIEEAIASLDVGVVASLGSEGSSRITYEYMASGVPVVATTVGGIPEILEDGRTGLLVPPGDSVALAEGIIRVLGSDSLRADLVRNALDRARAIHSFDRWIAETLSVYEAAIAWGRK
jgi:glycosyltransferase involved in cell wall biosynthesis